jgi:exodeoxyribonuclease-3
LILLENGFIDSFRFLNKEPDTLVDDARSHSARSDNKGWRIDYCLVRSRCERSNKRALILPEAKHSDHCPF